MYQYPYGNAQQLNLDWILSKLQELESGSGGGADLEKVANALVSASFDATIPYRKYDYAFYDGKLYRALNDTIGAFNPADWLEVTLGADIPVLTRLVNADSALITTLQNMLQNLGSDDVANESTVTGTNVSDALGNLNGAINDVQGQICAYVENDNIANIEYHAGEFLVYNGNLYLVGTLINPGDTLIPNTNIYRRYLASELTSSRPQRVYCGQFTSDNVTQDFAINKPASQWVPMALEIRTNQNTVGNIFLMSSYITEMVLLSSGSFRVTRTGTGIWAGNYVYVWLKSV